MSGHASLPAWSMTQLLHAVEGNGVRSLYLGPTRITVSLSHPGAGAPPTVWVVAGQPPSAMRALTTAARAHGVTIANAAPSGGAGGSSEALQIGLPVVAICLLAALTLVLRRAFRRPNSGRGSPMRLAPAGPGWGAPITQAQSARPPRQGSGGSVLSRLRPPDPAPVAAPEAEARVTFASVGGIDEVRDELVEVVDFLRNPERYWRLHCELPRGVLLVGEPGTGKTLLARAVAGEAGVPFLHMAGSEFVEVYVGIGASRVRQLFQRAREAGSAIVFIDEIDAVGTRRAGSPSGNSAGTTEQNHTLNQLLTELDGFTPRSRIVVLGATNRVDVLDPALLRPGRFDQQIVVHVPDRAGREAILRIHTQKVPLAPEVDLNLVARRTTGWTGAHLKNLVNRAALWSARRDLTEVTMAAFEASYQQALLGPARAVTMRAEEKERMAYHEAGHALLALLAPGAMPLASVSITPRGRSGGATLTQAERDTQEQTVSELGARLVRTFGGRVAEELRYDGDFSTAAEEDMQEATVLAAGMVTKWGMSDLGPANLAALEVARAREGLLSPAVSDATAFRVDEAVSKLLHQSLTTARAQITANRAALGSLARALVAQETLNAEEIAQVVGRFNPDG